MKICLYTGTALPKVGGHELVVDALARQYQQAGHEVVVLAPRSTKSWLVRNWPFPYPMVRHPRFLGRKVLVSWYRHALLKLHRRYKFDVVHSHGIYPTGYIAALCQPQIQTPLVMTSHGPEADPSNRRLQDPVLHARLVKTLDTAGKLIAISKFIRDGYLKFHPAVASKIVELPNGVDIDTLASPAERPAGLDPAIEPGGYALFIGRLDRRKGVDLLLEALARLPATGKVQLVIVGDGEELAALQRQAAELGLRDRVRFTGLAFGDEKTYLLQNSRFTVAPSRGWEGLPLVALESFAAGKPVISSDLAGFAEVVLPGKTGICVPENSVEALTGALRQFFGEPEHVARLGHQAREFVQAYSWRSIADQHLAIYADLLGSAQRRRAA